MREDKREFDDEKGADKSQGIPIKAPIKRVRINRIKDVEAEHVSPPVKLYN